MRRHLSSPRVQSPPAGQNSVFFSSCSRCGFSHTLFHQYEGKCARCGNQTWLTIQIKRPHPETIYKATRETTQLEALK